MKKIIISLAVLLLLSSTFVPAMAQTIPEDSLEFENTTFYYDTTGYELKLTEKVSGLACVMYDENGKYVAGDSNKNGRLGSQDISIQRSADWNGTFKLEPLAAGTHTIYIFDLAEISKNNTNTSDTISVTTATGFIQTITITILDADDKDGGAPDNRDKIVYGILNQPSGAYTGKGDYTIRIDADYDKFVELILDGVVVDTKNYTTAEGSTIITLKESYLKSVSNGDHVIRAEFTDGYVDIAFSVNVKVKPGDNSSSDTKTPQTGDTGSAIWAILGISSLACLVVGVMKKRRIEKIEL